MIFNKKKASLKLSKAEKKRVKRLKRTLTASTQNSLRYQWLTSDGLMKVCDDTFSRTFHLGDVSYLTANDEEQLTIVETCADIYNSLDMDNTVQLLLVNRRMDGDTLSSFYYDLQGDEADSYREEYNQIIADGLDETSGDQSIFTVDKYLTITTKADNEGQAKRILLDTANNLEGQYNGLGVSFESLEGIERLSLFARLLRGEDFLDFDYKDIAISGLSTKDFIAPNYLKFDKAHFQLDGRYAKVLYARSYPSFLNDKLLKNILATGIELAISLVAEPYDTGVALKKIKTVDSSVRREMIKSQKEAFKSGIMSDLAVGGKARETSKETEKWAEEITDKDQQMFSGLLAIFVTADSLEELAQYTEQIRRSVRKNRVELEECYLYQEEALNTILPIGLPFLNVKRRFMRDMTTANLATQVPFTNVDLRSNSPKALYYGKNQLSKNPITLDRKRDLNTGSGVIFGASGSGKSVFAKAGEIIPTLLRYVDDRIIIVDPEDEYSDIGQEFGAEIIKIAPNSGNNFNLLERPDSAKLQDGDNDLVGLKVNLISSLFENVLSEVSDAEFSMVDRVTKLVYERFEQPTFRDWQEVLEEQPEAAAKSLALKAEPYTKGSNDIFAHATNVNMHNRFIIFNLKHLSGKLKPFAMLVIQDYIWNQVINNQGVRTTRLYFDEFQLYFKNQSQAIFFTELYSRIRKYGAIPTGITQNPETVLSSEEGRKLLSNSEFIVLLRMKATDLDSFSTIKSLTPSQERFTLQPKARGTGLIIAGDTIVPFENPIPKDTKLFQLVATDSDT